MCGARVSTNARIDGAVIGRGDDERRVTDCRLVVRPLLDEKMLIRHGPLQQGGIHDWSANADRRAPIEQRDGLPRRDVATADDECRYGATTKYDGNAECAAHKNFPAAGPTTRIATYRRSTAMNVTLE